MKKIFYLFSITFLILQSCSSGESESTNTDTILIKKTIETDPQGIYTNIFEYNGNKIVKVNSLINNNLIGTAI